MKLREYLNEIGIPIAVFARRLGIAESTLHSILSGKHEPRLNIAIRIEELTKGQVQCKELVLQDLPKDQDRNPPQKKPSVKKK